MNFKRFSLILDDLCQNDNSLPPLIFARRKQFKELSFKEWAGTELKNYVSSKMPLNIEKTIYDYIDVVESFRGKMLKYYTFNKENSDRFLIAAKVSEEVIDLLNAMV